MTARNRSGASRWKSSALLRGVIAGRWSYAPTPALCLLLFFGCSESVENDRSRQPFHSATTASAAGMPSELDSLLLFIGEVDQEALSQAFAGLDRREFTRYTRTEQFDEEEYLIAYEERVTRHQGRPEARSFITLQHDSAGTFDFGYFRRFVSKEAASLDPTDLAQHVVPDDPAYLSTRHREAYSYRILPDTVMWDETARVIEVRARPDEGDDQNIRRARLYVDRASKRLIAIYIERIDRAMWYREESRFYIHIRPAPDGSWVPYNTRFETRIGVPFRPTQRFRTVSTYYRYADEVNG